MAQRIMKEQEFESDVFDRGTWQKVFQLLWEHKKIVIPLIFFNTILAVTDVIMPLLNRYALNTYVDDQTGADTLPVFILVYVGMILAQCLLVYLFFRLAARVESDFGKNLREKCFRKLQEQTFSYFDRTANGWLMARITSDTARLAETLAWAFVDVVWGILYRCSGLSPCIFTAASSLLSGSQEKPIPVLPLPLRKGSTVPRQQRHWALSSRITMNFKRKPML